MKHVSSQTNIKQNYFLELIEKGHSEIDIVLFLKDICLIEKGIDDYINKLINNDIKNVNYENLIQSLKLYKKDISLKLEEAFIIHTSTNKIFLLSKLKNTSRFIKDMAECRIDVLK